MSKRTTVYTVVGIAIDFDRTSEYDSFNYYSIISFKKFEEAKKYQLKAKKESEKILNEVFQHFMEKQKLANPEDSQSKICKDAARLTKNYINGRIIDYDDKGIKWGNKRNESGGSLNIYDPYYMFYDHMDYKVQETEIADASWIF